MDDTGKQTKPAGSKEIDWDMLDKMKYYVYGTGMFTGITTVLYPVSVVKTRLQLASPDAIERNAYSVVKSLLKTHGVPGLYKGFAAVIIGTVPSRIIFLTVLEKTKLIALMMIKPLNLSEPTEAALVNGIGGMVGTICSQTIYTPVEVVSQKLMVQGYSGHTTYSGGLDVVRKVIKSDGIQGLFRGIGLSLATYVPSSAVWWATYGSSQHFIWRLLGGTEGDQTASSVRNTTLVQAAAGICAGASSSCVTHPLDVLKTHWQVMGHENKPTARQVIKSLFANQGWTGLYKGLGPRVFNVSLWGTTMVVGYENLKRVSAKKEQTPQQ